LPRHISLLFLSCPSDAHTYTIAYTRAHAQAFRPLSYVSPPFSSLFFLLAQHFSLKLGTGTLLNLFAPLIFLNFGCFFIRTSPSPPRQNVTANSLKPYRGENWIPLLVPLDRNREDRPDSGRYENRVILAVLRPVWSCCRPRSPSFLVLASTKVSYLPELWACAFCCPPSSEYSFSLKVP
jgi:hypothetical protein